VIEGREPVPAEVEESGKSDEGSDDAGGQDEGRSKGSGHTSG
jgi:hypothetical protein